MKRFLFLAGILGIILLAGLAYYFFSRPEQPSVGIQFGKPSSVLVGQPFTLTVSFSNYSDKILQDAKLSLILPDDLVFLGQDSGQRVMEQSLGDVGPGSIHEQPFNLIAVGGSQTLKHAEAKLVYHTNGSAQTQFEAREATDIAVGAAALNLLISAPQNVISGEQFELSVKYENQSEEDLKNLHLTFEYPSSFEYKESSVAPERGNNVWQVGTLRRGESGELKIAGVAVGAQGSFFDMKSTVAGDFLGQSYPLAMQTATIAISASPLSLSVERTGGSPEVARIGETVDYQLHYKNSSDVAMENAVVTANLSGELYDFSTLRSDGAFNSVSNTVTWSVANVPALASIPPGGEGAVSFSVKLKGAFPIRRVSDKNYFLRVKAQIESPTVPPKTAVAKSVSVARLDTKMRGEAQARAFVLVHDPKLGAQNSGPYPPKANVKTQYAIHWTVTNYATDLQHVRLAAFLQSGARMTGVVKSNIDSAPTYNAATGEVTWDIPSIPATKGVVSAPVEGIFQIEQTPAVNQVGQSVVLLGETKFDATDAFTSSTLSDIQPPLTSDAQGDPSLSPSSDRRVQP